MKHRFCSLIWVFIILTVFSKNSFAQETVHIDSLLKRFYEKTNQDLSQEALSLNEQISAYYLENGNSMEWVRAKMHKAEILRASAELEEAIATINEAEETNEKLEPSTVKSTFYNRKAAILFELMEHNKAIVAVKESQRIDSLKNYKWRILSNYILEGAIYRETDKTKKAVDILKKTIDIAAEQSDLKEYKLALFNIANCYYKIDEPQKALKSCNKYLSIDTVSISINHKGDIYTLMYKAYKKLGIADSALLALEQAHWLRLKKMERLTEENAKANKQASVIAKQKIENYKLEGKNEKRNLQFTILILALTVSGISAFLLYKRRNFYKTLNRKQEELNMRLSANSAFNTKLMAILAHDIRNPMIGITGMLKMYFDGDLSEHELKKHIKSLYTNAQNVNFLIENILNWIKSQDTKINLEITEINLLQLIKKIEGELSIVLSKKGLFLNTQNIKDDQILMSDRDILHLALRNILTNAIKFSAKESEIKFDFRKSSNYYCIDIIDHGAGIDQETLQKINNMQSISKQGSQQEKGTGLGLPLTLEIMAALNGKIEIASELGKGTKVSIYLPV